MQQAALRQIFLPKPPVHDLVYTFSGWCDTLAALSPVPTNTRKPALGAGFPDRQADISANLLRLLKKCRGYFVNWS